MFDLHVPESMANLPGRRHRLEDDEPEGMPLHMRLRLDASLSEKIYRSVMRDLKQCKKCRETDPARMLICGGIMRHICKKCHSLRTCERARERKKGCV